MAEKINVQKETDLKAKVFKIIKRGSFNSGEIAAILGKNEETITNLCNQLVKENAIEYNPKSKDKLRYRVIQE
ncbi:MAG: hypothetical protein R6U96_18785 [Promethearchaeia archaeon]